MQSFTEISGLINNSKRILMTLHVSPDGDCTAACLAMGNYLQSIGKDFSIISYHTVPEYITRVLDTKSIEVNTNIENTDLTNFDLLLGLDMGFEHLCTMNKEYKFPATLKKINMDHHHDNCNWGDINYIDPTNASTCGIIYDFLNYLNIPITDIMANIIAVGILTDTGFLKNSNTKAKDFRTIADLTDKGFKISNFSKMQLRSLKEIKYEGIVYSNIRISTDRRYLYSWTTLKEKEALGIDNNEQMPKASNYLQKIYGFDFAFFINERLDEEKLIYSVSFRSIDPNIDVSAYATALGGSGHKNAAGAIISDAKTLDEAIAKVIKVL